MAYIGYIRYSESDRSREPLRHMIERYCASNGVSSCDLYEEVADETKSYRTRQLCHLLSTKLQPGDTLLCPTVTMLSRSPNEISAIANTCKNLGVHLVCIKEGEEIATTELVSMIARLQPHLRQYAG